MDGRGKYVLRRSGRLFWQQSDSEVRNCDDLRLGPTSFGLQPELNSALLEHNLCLVFCLPAVLLWLPCSAAESEMTTPTPTVPNCELPACAAIASLSLTTTISYRGPSGMFLPYLLSGIRLALQHIIRYSYLGRPEEVVSLVLPHVFSAHLDSEVSQYRLYAHTSG